MFCVIHWPTDPDELIAVQQELATATPGKPQPSIAGPLRLGGCFACFPRGVVGPGQAGDRVWAAAVVMTGHRIISSYVHEAAAGGGYTSGLLALREGPALEAAVRGLDVPIDALLVNATGRDHPRRAGLALHLGFVLDLPTVGITHRPLVAIGDWPADDRGARSPLVLDYHDNLDGNGGNSGNLGDNVVGYWLRTRAGTRPLAVHAGWRTNPELAVRIALQATARHRTPEPLRRARRLARQARSEHDRRLARQARSEHNRRTDHDRRTEWAGHRHQNAGHQDEIHRSPHDDS